MVPHLTQLKDWESPHRHLVNVGTPRSTEGGGVLHLGQSRQEHTWPRHSSEPQEGFHSQGGSASTSLPSGRRHQMDMIWNYSFSQTQTHFSPSERTKMIRRHVTHIPGFLFVLAFLNPMKGISLLRSPAVFKLEKIDIGFKRTPSGTFSTCTISQCKVSLACLHHSAICMLMAQS